MWLPRGRVRPGSRTVLVASIAMLVVLALAGAFVLRSQGALAGTSATRPVHETHRTERAGSGAAPAAEPARRLPSLVIPEPPLTARLPNGESVSVDAVSTRADRTLDVPGDVKRAGWWRGGSRLGDPFGSMLVAAHIDSQDQGLGPFATLLTARSGQRVRITSAHLRQDFVVSSRRLVPQGSLSRERWLFAPSGPFRLTLVTCAPPYDPSRGGYQNLAVVTAVPFDDPVPSPGS
jgi:hypothetical protein